VRRVFRRALGLTFRVESFGRYGYVELDLTKKVAHLDSFTLNRTCFGAPERAARRAPSNKRFEAGGARRLWNESFSSAPQLKRDPLGRTQSTVHTLRQ